MSEILDNIYIWVFLVNSESVLLLAFVKYILQPFYSNLHFFVSFGDFLETLVLWRKVVQNFSYLYIYFVQKTAQLILGRLP